MDIGKTSSRATIVKVQRTYVDFDNDACRIMKEDIVEIQHVHMPDEPDEKYLAAEDVNVPKIMLMRYSDAWTEKDSVAREC